jgi:putative redox protein
MVDKSVVNVRWGGGGSFSASDSDGHVSLIQTHSEKDAKALSPSQLFLASMGACSAVDLVTILSKRRKKLESLNVTVEGERAEGFPARYTKISLLYRVKGEGIEMEELKRALNLSMEKYCSFALTVKNSAPVEWSFRVE